MTNPHYELVRVSRELVDELLAHDSEPVVVVALERQEDGTCDMIFKTPEAPVTVWMCPDCGEQVSDEPEQDPRTYKYVRGHYHEPPIDWPEGEDPWFDAVERKAILVDRPPAAG